MERAEFAAAIREKYMLNESLDTGQRFEVYDALFHTGSKLLEYFGSKYECTHCGGICYFPHHKHWTIGYKFCPHCGEEVTGYE